MFSPSLYRLLRSNTTFVMLCRALSQAYSVEPSKVPPSNKVASLLRFHVLSCFLLFCTAETSSVAKSSKVLKLLRLCRLCRAYFRISSWTRAEDYLYIHIAEETVNVCYQLFDFIDSTLLRKLETNRPPSMVRVFCFLVAFEMSPFFARTNSRVRTNHKTFGMGLVT